VGRYDKVHLVPYGEYIPMRRWMPFLNPIVQSVGDFTPGERIAPMDSPLGKIGVLICFESIFPDLSRKMVRQGAWLLVNLTNDAWHGRTSEPYQHMSMSQMRSVENRRPTARATNTGISAFVDEAGRTQETLGLFQRGALTRSIAPGLQGLSFYTRFGDVFAILCLILSGLMVVHLRCPWRS
jgi:apolipoprotein N-acyltransferase